MERLLHKAGDTQGSYCPDDRRLERQKEGRLDWQVHPSMAWVCLSLIHFPSSVWQQIFQVSIMQTFYWTEIPLIFLPELPTWKAVWLQISGYNQVWMSSGHLIRGTKMEAIISDSRLWRRHNKCVHLLQSQSSSYFSCSQGWPLISLRYEGCRTRHPQICLFGIRIILNQSL